MCKTDLIVDFEKGNGLIPAIVQDSKTNVVLMLGYMNAEALSKTQQSGKVTFFSRSKNRLWTKGEESGNFLELVSIKADCDNDTLLVKANPIGPTCHTGNDTCWNDENKASYGFLSELESVIDSRYINRDEKSYTASLFNKGIKKIVQKVGEEAVESIIEAQDRNIPRLKEEVADLLFHTLVMLRDCDVKFDEVIKVLEQRHK